MLEYKYSSKLKSNLQKYSKIDINEIINENGVDRLGKPDNREMGWKAHYVPICGKIFSKLHWNREDSGSTFVGDLSFVFYGLLLWHWYSSIWG